MHISMSDVKAFLACQRSWQWGNAQNLGHISGYKAEALQLGTGIHDAIERFYRGDGDMTLDQLFLDWYRAWAEEHGESPLADDSVRLALAMLHGYRLEYSCDEFGPGEDSDFTVVTDASTGHGCVEQQFCVHIPGTDDDWLVGTADGLIRRADGAYGAYWLIDHKTASSFPHRDTLVLNLQFLGYTWAFNRMALNGRLEERFGISKGDRIAGVLYNGLRKQMPSKSVRSPLFMREWVGHNQQELQVFTRTLRDVAATMHAMIDGRLPVLAAPDQHCDWCAFQTPCIAKQLDEDWEWLLQTQYAQKPSRGAVYDNELRLEK